MLLLINTGFSRVNASEIAQGSSGQPDTSETMHVYAKR